MFNFSEILKNNPLAIAIPLGWFCLALSSICFYISTESIRADINDAELTYAMWLIGARLFGIGAFVVACLCIFNKWWTNGTLLFLGSVGLPFLSLFYHGSL